MRAIVFVVEKFVVCVMIGNSISYRFVLCLSVIQL